MIFHDVIQNSDEWDVLRLGKFTASMISDLFMGENTLGYKKAIYKIAYERLTGEKPESFEPTNYMARGHEMEILARAKYEDLNMVEVSNGGFWEYSDWIGCSPDGVCGKGIIEIKSPAYNTMIGYLLKPQLPTIYKYQVYSQLYITGKEYCDFICFHPKLPFICIRIERDELLISEIQSRLVPCRLKSSKW